MKRIKDMTEEVKVGEKEGRGCVECHNQSKYSTLNF